MSSIDDSDADKTCQLKHEYENLKRKGEELSLSEEEAVLTEILNQPEKMAMTAPPGTHRHTHFLLYSLSFLINYTDLLILCCCRP